MRMDSKDYLTIISEWGANEKGWMETKLLTTKKRCCNVVEERNQNEFLYVFTKR